MSIGRNFKESLQKALRSLETDLTGLDEIEFDLSVDDQNTVIHRELAKQTPDRLLVVGQALRAGFSVDTINEITGIDPWFLRHIEEIVADEKWVKENGLPKDSDTMRALKMDGFSDARLGLLTGQSEQVVRAHRHGLDVRPVYKRVDTCAAEFAAKTPYMYSTYEHPSFDDVPQCESNPTDRKKVIILGGGPNRIGQGIEFDYCCCHAAYALGDIGIESIMVNCNPETVSTDYDTSDRLYFEPLTEEDVLELMMVEQKRGTLAGVIVQFGGQTPLKLAQSLEDNGIKLLGTPSDALDRAEDRERFKALVEKLGLLQPRNAIVSTAQQAEDAANNVGYPVVLRPSNVLGGRGMEIVEDMENLRRYVSEAVKVSGKSPLLIDQYLVDAIEIDVDAICDGEDVFVAAVMEHIEEAGVHSGDSACSLPPYSLSPIHHRRVGTSNQIIGIRTWCSGLDECAIRGQGQ